MGLESQSRMITMEESFEGIASLYAANVSRCTTWSFTFSSRAATSQKKGLLIGGARLLKGGMMVISRNQSMTRNL